MNEIIQKENPILRKTSEPVSVEEIKSRRIETIIRRMIKALNKEDDGVAIAAPQIGENVRIFIVSKKLFEIMEDEEKSKRPKSKRETLNEFDTPKPEYKDMIFINPEIVKMSKNKIDLEEGCLSVRWLYGKVKRSEKTLVRAYDENGKIFSLGGSGILSQVFQHEIDHLDGILFIDKAKDLRDLPPEGTK